MDELLKSIERHRNTFVAIGVLLVGSFLVALGFSLNNPSDILQALATLLGSALSGGVAAVVAIIILKREEKVTLDLAAETRRARQQEVEETEQSVIDWLASALFRVETILEKAAVLVCTTGEPDIQAKTAYIEAVHSFKLLELNAEILKRVGRDRPLLIARIEDAKTFIERCKLEFSKTVTKMPDNSTRYMFIVDVRVRMFPAFVGLADLLAQSVERFADQNKHLEPSVRFHLERFAAQIKIAIEIAVSTNNSIPAEIMHRNAMRLPHR